MFLTKIRDALKSISYSFNNGRYNIHMGPNTLSGDDTVANPKWNGNELSTLKPATNTTLGGVIIGNRINVDSNGKISGLELWLDREVHDMYNGNILNGINTVFNTVMAYNPYNANISVYLNGQKLFPVIHYDWPPNSCSFTMKTAPNETDQLIVERNVFLLI